MAKTTWRLSNDGFYLLHVSGGTEPSVLGGPIKDYDRMVSRARKFWNDRARCRQEYDGLFYLKVQNGRPSVGAFTADELEEEAPRIPCPSGECGGVIEEDGNCSDCGKHYQDKSHG